MSISTVGIDLAKSVFQVHGVDDTGRTLLQKQLRRSEMLPFFARLTPCLIGIEACGGSHFWARELSKLGHHVRLMSPQFVKPYVKSNKNDVADAEAICEAVRRPNMRFVAVKTVDQQAVLSLHRARASVIKARTALANQIRGLLAEYGIVVGQGIERLYTGLAPLIDRHHDRLPGVLLELFDCLREQLAYLRDQASQLEAKILAWHRSNAASKRLAEIQGIGVLTATAFVATIGDAATFKNGRQVAALLGLVPRQRSSGGKTRLEGISKRGDSYLRTLLVHGGRAILRRAEHHPKPDDRWLTKLVARRNKNIAVIALANRNARIAWALLAHDRRYDQNWRTRHSVV